MKIKNFELFKENFSKILSSKYKFDKDDIEDFWNLKAREERYENNRKVFYSAELGALVGDAVFATFDAVNHKFDCAIPAAIIGGVTVLAGAITLVKKNPYKKLISSNVKASYKEEAKKKIYK